MHVYGMCERAITLVSLSVWCRLVGHYAVLVLILNFLFWVDLDRFRTMSVASLVCLNPIPTILALVRLVTH